MTFRSDGAFRPATAIAAMLLPGDCDTVVGATPTLLTRPSGAQMLALLIEAGAAFRARAGDYLPKTFTANATTNVITTGANHGLATGDGPFKLSSSGSLPGGLSASVRYWVVRVDPDELQLALSEADAVASLPVVVDITSAGTGTHTLGGVPISPAATTVDGYSSIPLAAPAGDPKLLVCPAPARLTVQGAGAGDKLTYWWW